MTYDLYIGDRTFSSWSLRGWLMFEKFGLPHRTHLTGLYSGRRPRTSRRSRPRGWCP